MVCCVAGFIAELDLDCFCRGSRCCCLPACLDASVVVAVTADADAANASTGGVASASRSADPSGDVVAGDVTAGAVTDVDG